MTRRRIMPPDLPELRRLNALGLAKARTQSIDVIAAIRRRLLRGELSEEARHTAELGLLHWEHLPALIDAVTVENDNGGTDEWNALRNALQRAVQMLFEADDSDEDDAPFNTAYEHLRACHNRITEYLNEGTHHGTSQESTNT